ncbi:MAG: hypothetical protein AABW48_04105 [Nanoarchaeota archaeon]
MNKFWEIVGGIASIITIFLFIAWFIEGNEKLDRGPCPMVPDIIYGTININQAPVEGITIILKNERINSIITTETSQDGHYQLAISNFPECWLEGDKISLFVQQDFTDYQNSAILRIGGTEISVTK